MKTRILAFLKTFGIVFPLSLVVTFSSLLCGVSFSDNTAASMALAFDKYLKTTDQDFISAKFYSDDPRDPIRRGEFVVKVSAYQNFWQLKKGPDNSLIRVIDGACMESEGGATIYPLTLYPKEDALDDSGAITPTIYTGFDQDFRGDYLDIKIVQLKDKTKQIKWSDFYKGGKMEKYKTDSHSIMITQKVARQIYSSRFDIPIDDVTDENIESLVGTILRCKLLDQNGINPYTHLESEAVEREQNRPAEDQDSEILNSPYYSPQYSRLKKIIGILDDDSATKYNPIFGDNFIFVIPYKEVSYDYFHPTVYGMFKSNFVGNRTSLRYFLAFSDFIFSKNGKGYHLHFCNITNGVLNENGSLQKNYNSCINYFRTNKHSVVAGIMFFVSLVSTAALIFITYRHFLKNKKRNNLSSSSCLMILLTCLFLSILIFYLLRYFVFMSFYLPTLSIGGFGLLLFADLSVIVLLLLLLKKKMHCSDSIIERVNQKEMAARTSKLEKWRFAYFLRQAAISVLLGIFIFILINVLASKTSTSSIGIPAIAAISGIIVAVFIDKYIFVSEYFNVKKRMLLKELICSGLAFLGISIGIIAGATFGHFDFIWISGIGFSIQKIAVSFVAAILIYLSLFWAALILRDMFIQFKSQCDNRFGKGSDYETLDI